MIRRLAAILVCAAFLIATEACTKKQPETQLTLTIPSGFSGNFLLEMGVKDAPPLSRQGDGYVATVPQNGKIVTSTVLAKPRVTFRNASDGAVWGYSQSVFTTGDGILVGGKIQFFVGTRKQYDAEENHKDHSEGFPILFDSSRFGG